MIKADLRKIFLEKRHELTASQKDDFSKQIASLLFDHFHWQSLNFVHLFLPIKSKCEFDTSLVYQKLWRDFPAIRIIVPRINRILGEIENLEFNSKTQTTLSCWNIPEPVGNTLIKPGKIDLVIVPLLCFDSIGNRVGYGRGFYDRMLVQCREDCIKLGVSFFAPITKIADSHKNDVTLDYCVTPDKVYKF